MPFPESDRVIFEENPITEVICQLRFPTVLAIAAEAPAEFQDRLRDTYPIYVREDAASRFPPEVAALVGGLAAGMPSQGVTHRFENEDATLQISLTSEFVAITSRIYVRWEHFRSEVERAKEALEAVYAPAFYTRIGLRYQDVIDRKHLKLEDQPWSELVKPELLGLLSAEQSVSDSVMTTRSDNLVKMAEVPEAAIKLTHGIVDSSDGSAYGVDADLFLAQRIGGEDVLGVLDTFHREAGNLFRWAITPRLHDALRPRPIDAE